MSLTTPKNSTVRVLVGLDEKEEKGRSLHELAFEKTQLCREVQQKESTYSAVLLQHEEITSSSNHMKLR